MEDGVGVAGIIVSLLIFAVSIVLVIVGWDVIYKNARRIATQNEMFNQVNSVCSEIVTTKDLAVSFWVKSKDDLTRESCLLHSAMFASRVNSIDRNIQRLKDLDLEIEQHTNIREMRRSITLDMERAEKIALVDKASKVQDIISHSDDLIQELQNAFIQFKGHIATTRKKQ